MCLLTEADSVAHSLQSTTRTSCGTCSRVTAGRRPRSARPSSGARHASQTHVRIDEAGRAIAGVTRRGAASRAPNGIVSARETHCGARSDRPSDRRSPPCNNRLRVFRSRSRALFVSECKALIFSDVALEGFRFLAITFAKFAGSSSNSFGNMINPISSRFAFSQATAAAGSSSCFRAGLSRSRSKTSYL